MYVSEIKNKKVMKKRVKQLRDINKIETELFNSTFGVCVVCLEEGSFRQFGTTFLYKDKNLYMLVDDKDFYNSILSESSAVFTLIKKKKNHYLKSINAKTSYNILAISLKGMVKKIEDEKIASELYTFYMDKYSTENFTLESNDEKEKNIIKIDTEEIQAFEEMGG